MTNQLRFGNGRDFSQIKSLIATLTLFLASSLWAEGISSQLNFTIGPAFGIAHAVDGKHGGMAAGIVFLASTSHLEMGSSIQFIGEITNPLSHHKTDPSERYLSTEFISGLKLPINKVIFSGGLGGGLLWGKARTELFRSDTNCVMGFFSIECLDTPEVTNRYYSQNISTISVSPYARVDFQLKRFFGLGVMYKAILNDKQGLGVFSILWYYGNRQ